MSRKIQKLLLFAVLSSAAAAQTPPGLTPEERIAAFPDLGGMTMAGHMNDDPFNAMLLVDRLEWQENNALVWDVSAWAGRDENKLWLRSEGERRSDRVEHAGVELLWGRPLSRWWDWFAGLRHDTAPSDGRTWAALGVQGFAPYKFEVQATLYLGEPGRVAARFEIEYELLLSQRLILQPRLEANLYRQDAAVSGTRRDLDDVSVGLRLRYEIRREFAPYVGIERTHRFGDAVGVARERREDADDTRLIAGLRIWF